MIKAQLMFWGNGQPGVLHRQKLSRWWSGAQGFYFGPCDLNVVIQLQSSDGFGSWKYLSFILLVPFFGQKSFGESHDKLQRPLVIIAPPGLPPRALGKSAGAGTGNSLPIGGPVVPKPNESMKPWEFLNRFLGKTDRVSYNRGNLLIHFFGKHTTWIVGHSLRESALVCL